MSRASHRARLAGMLFVLGLLPLLGASAAAQSPDPDGWEPLGPYIGGWYTDVCFDPFDASRVYLPSWCGGLHVSEDGGSSWTWQESGGDWHWRLRPDPRNAGHFLSIGWRGILRSVDGGQTWQETCSEQAFCVAFGPGSVVYAGGDGRVLRSNDSGLTWSPSTGGLPSYLVWSVAAHPTNGEVVYAACRGELYRSVDGGLTFTAISDSAVDGWAHKVLTDPSQPTAVYMAGSGVSRSTDGGLTWQRCFQGGWVADLDVTGSGTLAVATHCWDPEAQSVRACVSLSSDHGQTWQPYSDGFLAGSCPYELAIAPGGNRMLLATYIGLYGWSAGETAWEMLSVESRSEHCVQDLTMHPDDSNRVAMTTWNALFLSHDRGDSWSIAPGPPNWDWLRRVSYDPHNPGTLVATGFRGVYETPDEGQTWTRHEVGQDVCGLEALRIDPSDPQTIWVGGWEGLYRTTDRGATWLPMTNNMEFVADTRGVLRTEILSIAVDLENSNKVYAGGNNRVFVSEDRGATWLSLTDLSLDFPFVIALEVDPYEYDRVFGGTSSACVFRSTDAGYTWPLQRMLYSHIHDFVFGPCCGCCRVFDPCCGCCHAIYTAASWGVYRSLDDGETWENFNLGDEVLERSWVLAEGRTRANHKGDYSLFAGTGGRGVYRLNIVNFAPSCVVSAVPVQGEVPLEVLLDAETSDPEGNEIVLYQWDFESDGHVDYSSASSPEVTHVYAEAGEYVATLTIRDCCGAEGSDSVSIVAEAPVLSPPRAILSVESNPVYADEEAVFPYSGEDDDGVVVLYELDFESDGVFDFVSEEPGTVSHLYGAVGEYEALLRVTDDDDLQGSAIVVVQVLERPGNEPPTADADAKIYHEEEDSPNPPMPSLSIEPGDGETGALSYAFVIHNTGDESKDDAANIQVEISVIRGNEYVESVVYDPLVGDLEDGGSARVPFEVVPTAAWAAASDGEEIKLEIVVVNEDNRPEHNEGRLARFTIVKGAPALEPVPDLYGAAPFVVDLLGTGEDVDGFLVLYEWDFDGDGDFDWSSDSGGRVTHTYELPGVYEATLRVWDDGGLSATDSVTIDVHGGRDDDDGAGDGLAHSGAFTLLASQRNEVSYQGALIEVPYGALSSDSVLHVEVSGTNPTGSRLGLGGSVVSFLTLSLDGNPVLARSMVASLPYLDADQDGYVDGAGELATLMRLSFFHEPLGLWVTLPDQTIRLGETRVQAELPRAGVFCLAALDSTNQAPVLQVADELRVAAGERVELEASASDADGDPFWVLYDGWMTASSRATTTQELGAHEVRVVAADDRGGADWRSVAVEVVLPAPELLLGDGSRLVTRRSEVLVEVTLVEGMAQLLVNGSSGGVELDTAAGVFRFLAQLALGTNTLRVEAVGADGSYSEATEFVVERATATEVCLGLGVASRGLVPSLNARSGGLSVQQWAQVGWKAYGSEHGQTRVALGDLDGDGRQELVLGLGPGGNGYFEILDDIEQGYAHLAWGRIPWSAYNRADGSCFPACGDLDGDGTDELVVGLASASSGWFMTGCLDQGEVEVTRWLRVRWGYYNGANGVVHPACGDVDGDGRDEIIAGLGEGSGGWLQVFDDASAGLGPLAWRRIPWGGYNRLSGAAWPACGNLDADAAEELLLGLSSESSGWFCQLDDLASGTRAVKWGRVAWGAYNNGVGESRLACGELDADGRTEVLVGLGVGASGWLECFEPSESGFRHRFWARIPWTEYNGADGSSRPAVE